MDRSLITAEIHPTQAPAPAFRWTVMAEINTHTVGEQVRWLRNDVVAGDDSQDAASAVWDLLEHQGYTVTDTVTCPTELACNNCGFDISDTNGPHSCE